MSIDRSRLHELVETLPEAALAVAQGALEHFQTWPPSEPPQIREIRESQRERMKQSMRPGTAGGGGGGGSYRMGPGGRIEHGAQSYSHWEGDVFVQTTHMFHAGHELVVEQRLQLIDHGTNLVYTDTITGSGRTAGPRELAFAVKLRE